MRARFMLMVLGLLLLAIAAGCGEKIDNSAPGALAMDETEHDRWEIALVDMRIEKNEEFRLSEQR